MVTKKKAKTTTKRKSTKANKNVLSNMSYGSYIFALGLLIALIYPLLILSLTDKTAEKPEDISVLESPEAIKIITITLIILGIIIGVFNISNKEAMAFLIATIVYVSLLNPFFMGIVQSFQIQNEAILRTLGNMFLNITTLVVPAALIVALKVIFATAKDEE